MKRIAWILCAVLMLCTVTQAVAQNATTTLSLTTGLETDQPYRPILVQINNAREARPIAGLSQADIVYESIYWGPAHTRYLAVYNDTYPEKVGSIRDTRVFFNELREMWDCPYVFFESRGEGESLAQSTTFFKRNKTPPDMLLDGVKSTSSDFAFKDEAKRSPHNVMANLSSVMEKRWPTGDDGEPYEPQLPTLLFADSPSAGTEPATTVDIVYGAKAYAVRYVYDEAARQYNRWYDGFPQMDEAGTEITASNVIVQYVEHTFVDGERSLPVIQTVGSGPIDAFIDGTHIKGTWERDEMGEWVRYLDENGEALVLLPGKTFIQLVPQTMAISYE